MPNQNYYFPIMFLMPDFEADSIELGSYVISKRKWETTTFDLATLSTNHKLHLSYQAMDLLLSYCNLELAILDKESLDDAIQSFKDFQLSLYSKGVSPILSPFITTYSINEYSGINSRDSEALRDKLPEGLREGLRSDEGTLEAWPFELSFQCTTLDDKRNITEEIILSAGAMADEWSQLKNSAKSLKAVENTISDAPKLVSLAQSILHIWSGLEGLFPNVSIELSFKLALYLSQLNVPDGDRLNYHKEVKKAYNLRSKIAHGATIEVDMNDWETVWNILMDSTNALIKRGKLPSEEELIEELLQ